MLQLLSYGMIGNELATKEDLRNALRQFQFNLLGRLTFMLIAHGLGTVALLQLLK